MKSRLGWTLIALFIVAAFTTLILLFKGWGILGSAALSVGFILVLYLLHQRRTKRLAQSLLPGETLTANGLVSDSKFDETPAILVRAGVSQYRLHVADKRGSQMVHAVSPALMGHDNPYDLKKYLLLHTDLGVIHFAPHNKLLVAEQPGYASQVLDAMLKDGVLVRE